MPLDVRVPIEPDNPSIVRAEEKCIKCCMCKNVCTQDIGVHGTYTLERTGGEAVCCLETNTIIVFSIKKGKVNYPPKNSFPKMNILS